MPKDFEADHRQARAGLHRWVRACAFSQLDILHDPSLWVRRCVFSQSSILHGPILWVRQCIFSQLSILHDPSLWVRQCAFSQRSTPSVCAIPLFTAYALTVRTYPVCAKPPSTASPLTVRTYPVCAKPPSTASEHTACTYPALCTHEKRLRRSEAFHVIGLSDYSMISVTTPEPTVLPPSLIANLSPSSIAIGVISSISMTTLSPGMHISVPSGR